MKYKVGDKVRVRKDLNESTYYGGYGAYSEMLDKVGCVVTIEKLLSDCYLINECGIEKRLLRRLRDNENVEIFSLDRICTVLNCDLDDIVEYVPNNPDIIEDAKTAQKEAAASHPVHTPSK